ncbi:MAG: geranylgeranyl reductase family protein [Candidatus Methylomirabilales bacterium]
MISQLKPYDVIVIGLGPAGAAAARDLGQAGLRVLALDKARHPRPKPCGGCLSLRVEQLLGASILELVERVIHGVLFTLRGEEPVSVRSRDPVAYLVIRHQFDAFLAERARKVGAEIREGEHVIRVNEHRDRALVVTDREVYQGRVVIGADGARSVVARSLGLQPKRQMAAAVDGEIWTRSSWPIGCGDQVRMDFGSIPGGYAWAFPKADHLSVGVGGFGKKVRSPKPYYHQFLCREGIQESIEEERRSGWVLPLHRQGLSRLTGRRTMLVGDAAALVESFVGEGIYYAIRSGQLAAQAILEGLAAGEDPPGPQRYEAAVQHEICRELDAAAKIGAVVYALPGFAYRMMQRRPALIGNYFRILRGEGRFVELWRRWRMAAGIELFRSLLPRLPGSKDRLVIIEDDNLRMEPRRPGNGEEL